MPHTPPRQLDHPLLGEVTSAVEAAGRELMRFYRSQNRITAKGVANFVSEADVAAESMLRELLLIAEPAAAFIGEESEVPPDPAALAGGSTWVVDPLDGTTNFLHGLPQFAVSVAYRVPSGVELGVVHNPASGEWFAAVRGQGAYLGGERIAVSTVADLSDGLYCFGFSYDRDRAMASTLRAVEALLRRQAHGIRRFGAAALDLAAIACGRFDGFFEFELQPWDVAAGGLIVEEAGGTVTDCSGRQVDAFGRSSVLATNGSIHPAMLEHLAPYYIAAT